MSERYSQPRLDPSLLHCLRSPRAHLYQLDRAQLTSSSLPLRTWGWLASIALLGSTLYGASLSLITPRWRPGNAGAWLTVSAGLSWCVFGPILAFITRRHPVTLAHACLVTMAYGEAALLTGAVANMVMRLARVSKQRRLALLNLVWVGLTNVLMAVILAAQLRAIDVPIRRTLILWFTILNGSGMLFFALFRRVFQKGGS